MKRIIALLLCLVLMAGVTLSVTAAETDERRLYNNNEYIYEVTAEDTVDICYYLGDGGKVVVPADIDGKPVKTIGRYAFYGTRITDLVISEGIENIADEAFFYCAELKSVILPESLKTVGTGLFRDCMNLEKVVFSGEASPLGAYMFYGCTRLNEVILPEKATIIPKGMFSYCKALCGVMLPDSLRIIDDYAFYHSGLIGIGLPYEVFLIGNMAFAYCEVLQDVYVFGNRKIEFVESDAFLGAGAWIEGDDYNSNPPTDDPNLPPTVETTNPPDVPSTSDPYQDGYYLGTTKDMAGFEGNEILRTNSMVSEDKKELISLAWNVRLMGDSNKDFAVNIKDATNIQLYAAGLIDDSSDNFDYKNSDVDTDGQITVRDATEIQKYIAGLVDSL